MAWVRMSDTFANHPIVLAAIEHADADERTVDEVAGYMTRLATLTAQNLTDYVVSYGTAVTLAGTIARANSLLALAEFAGWGHMVIDDVTGRKAFQLVDDPEFIHMKTREEIDWEKQRKADNSDPHLTVRIRLRDGDACRYCGRVVRFHGVRRGKLAGTYDHRPPGRPATAETSVVACTSCNSRRGAISRDEPSPESGLTAADKVIPLLAPPHLVYYSASTRVWLDSHKKLLAQYGLVPPPVEPESEDLKMGSPAPGYENVPIYRGTNLPDEKSSDTAPAIEPGVRPDSPPSTSADTAPVYRSVRPANPASDPGEDTAPADSGVRPSPGPGENSSDTAPIYNSVRPEQKNTEKQADPPSSDPAGSSRFRQVGSVQDLDLPGRDGTGRAGPDRDVSGLPGSQASPPGGRKRRRRGKRTRKPSIHVSSALDDSSKGSSDEDA